MALATLFRSKRLMIDPRRVQCGDIILSTRKSARGLAALLGAGGTYSHVAIALGAGLYAEAVGLGVRKRSIETMVGPGLTVLRLDPDRHPDAAQIARAAAAKIDEYLLAEYWLNGAFVPLFSATPFKERSGLFCSHLVAQVYKEVGVEIVEGLCPAKTTPQAMVASGTVRDVSDSTTFQPEFVSGYLLDERFMASSDREAVMLQGAFADVIDWFDQHKLPRPGRWYHLVRALVDIRPRALQVELDAALGSRLEANNYSRRPILMRKEALRPLLRMAARIARADLPERHARMEYCILQGRRPALERQAEAQKDNSEFYAQLFERTRLSTFAMLHLEAKAFSLGSMQALEAVDRILAGLRERYKFG